MTKELKKQLDTWISEKYEWLRDNVDKNICKGAMNQYTDDLVSHMVESLYNVKEEKIEQMLRDDKLQWFFLRGAGMQLRSSSSPFWHTYRKHKMSTREEGLPGSNKNIFDAVYEKYDSSLEDCFKDVWDNHLHWYNKAIIEKHFLQKWTLTEIHKYYNISKTHLVRDINEGINIIRERCKTC